MLYYGAGWLVKGSSSLAKSLGITPIVIGLTVVAFGTSAPELVVSLVSAVKGKSMIAVGNVIGSNICNIALILGAAAMLNPIAGSKSVVKRDIPLMLAISLFLLVLSLNSILSRIEGAALFLGIILYTYYNYFITTKSDKPLESTKIEVPDDKKLSRGKQLLMITVGIAGVVIGAQLVVDSAEKIMKVFCFFEKFIGLTIVAFGTSLPELATSIVAAIKKEMDISIGNLVGSNVFNILSVLGASALIRPVLIPGGLFESGLIIDYLVMMFVSVLAWLMMRNNVIITRKNGLRLFCCYVGYVGYLIIKI